MIGRAASSKELSTGALHFRCEVSYKHCARVNVVKPGTCFDEITMATPKAALMKPTSDEYAPYYEKYIALLPEGDIVTTLEEQLNSTLALLRGLDESQGVRRYAPDKWSVKEVIGHIIDGERVFAYRALRFARNDQNTFPPTHRQKDKSRNCLNASKRAKK